METMFPPARLGILSIDELLGAHWTPQDRKIVNTVASGDFLLAGFLKGIGEKRDSRQALTWAIQSATSRCLGWDSQRQWPACIDDITVCLEEPRRED